MRREDITGRLLEGIRHPAAAAVFLKDFKKIYPDMREAAIEDFRPYRDDPKAVGLLVGLLYNFHLQLSRAILSILSASSCERALTALRELDAAVPADHALKAQLKGPLESLQARKDAGGLSACAPAGIRFRAYLVAPDDVGSSAAIIAKRMRDGQISFLNLVFNDQLGIKQSFGAIVPERDFDVMVRGMAKEDGFLMAETTFESVLEFCRRAELATLVSGRDFLHEYFAWKWETAHAKPGPDTALRKRAEAFESIAALVPNRHLPPFRDLFDLFTCPCMRDWGFDTDVPRAEASRLAGMLEDGKRSNELPLGPIIDKGVPEADLPMWAKRLEDYALVRWMLSDEYGARLALWASKTLSRENRLCHPFLQALSLASVGMRPRHDDPEPAEESPSRSKASRNAPCPCGSGRKYKKCCMDKTTGGEARRFGPIPSSRMKLTERVSGYAIMELPQEEVDRAWTSFSGREETLKQGMAREPARFGDFTDWFIKGCDMGGRTVLERFEEERSFLCSDEERREFEGLKNNRFGVFEVVDVEPGTGVSLVDIFDGTRFEARDVSMSRQATRWDLIATWLKPSGTRAQLWGHGFPFPPEARQELTDLLKGAFKQIKATQPAAEWRRFLNASLPLVLRLQREIHERRTEALRRPVTPDGDPMAVCSAEYGVKDFRKALSVLRGLKNLIETGNLIGPDDRLSEAAFDWQVPLKKGWGKEVGSGVSIHSQRISIAGTPKMSQASIRLERERLMVECFSEKRLAKTRRMLEKALGRAVRFRDQSVRSLDDAVRECGPDEPAPKRENEHGEEGGIPPGLLAHMARAEAREWLKARIPALGGKTPREAARTEEGRGKLLDLLKIYENNYTRVPDRGGTGRQVQVAIFLELLALLRMDPPKFLIDDVLRHRELLSAYHPEESKDPLRDAYFAARKLYEEDRLSEAIEAYEKLKDRFRAHPMKHLVWADLGACLMLEGKLDRAVRCLEAAIEAKPDNEGALDDIEIARDLRNLSSADRRQALKELREGPQEDEEGG